MIIQSSDILLMWALVLLFLLWKTRSLRASVSTTLMVISLVIVALLHRLVGDSGCLSISLATLTALVWRVIPHEKVDRWNKG